MARYEELSRACEMGSILSQRKKKLGKQLHKILLFSLLGILRKNTSCYKEGLSEKIIIREEE